MAKRARHLTPAERRLWRQVTRTVTPRRPDVSLDDESEAPQDTLLEKKMKQQPDRTPARHKPPSNAKPPLQNLSDQKRVRRGRVEVEAKIDLHGLTQASAKKRLLDFFAQCRSYGMRHVLVVTGKGVDEPDAPFSDREARGVLRRRLPDWLGEPAFRAHVTGFSQAHRRHGGGGAFYVSLRKPGLR